MSQIDQKHDKELLITILVPSRRIKQLEGLIDTLTKNTTDHSRIQLIVKCDDDQLDDYKKLFEKTKENGKIDLKWVSSPRLLGPFTMWLNLQLMWKMVSKNSYFVFVVTDEGRFIVKGWDDEIAQYKHYYKDNIFRLRLSVSRDVNYYNINQTIFMPDCFPVYTRRWLEITEGFGDCWGSDAYQESIAYHLGRGTGFYWFRYPKNPVFRDLVINKRLVGGIDEFAQDLQTDEQKARSLLTMAEWKRLAGQRSQMKHCYTARKLFLEIKASEMGLVDYHIVDDSGLKTLVLYDNNNKKCAKASYKVPLWFTMTAVLQFIIFDNLMKLSHENRKKIMWVYSKSKTAFRYVVHYIKTLKAKLNSKPAVATKKDPIFDRVSGSVGVQHGALFTLENNVLAPSDLMLENLKIAKFVTCSGAELTDWVHKAYGDTDNDHASTVDEEKSAA